MIYWEAEVSKNVSSKKSVDLQAVDHLAGDKNQSKQRIGITQLSGPQNNKKVTRLDEI